MCMVIILTTSVSVWLLAFGDRESAYEDALYSFTPFSLVRSTETVTVSAKSPAPTGLARDVFGFPIVPLAPSSLPVDPPAHEQASTPPRGDTRLSFSSHFYREDGLLEVSPTGPHPIFELIRRAEQQWTEKNRKASKTLKQAFTEYQRRYRRLPPKGFDVWWTYVQSHSVQLPDEYDQIDRDLSPFWGVRPAELRRTQRDWEGQVDSFTVGRDTVGEEFGPLNYTAPEDERVKKQLANGATLVMEVLEEVEDYLPPFRAVFSPYDNPNLPSDWELRKEAERAAKAGRCEFPRCFDLSFPY